MKQNRKTLVLVITVILFVAQFIGNYGNYQLAAIPSRIYEAFHLTDMQFSSLMTAPMLPSIFLSIIIGLLVDRYGISRMVSICLSVAACGFLIRCFAGNYSVMLAAMALSGFGCMILNSNMAKIVSSLYPMDQVSKIVGILMAASTASMAVAFATTSAIPSLSIAFWIPAIVSIIVLAGWIVFARESVFSTQHDSTQHNPSPRDQAAPDAGAQDGIQGAQASVLDALKACARSRNIWLAGLTLMLILGAAMVISNFHVATLTSLKGYSEAAAGSFNTVLMIGSIIGSIVLPVYVTKNRKQAPILVFIMLFITAATCYGMVALPSTGIYICAFLNGALRSGVIATMMMVPVMLKEIGPALAGTAGGFIVTLELIGSVVIPTYIIVPLGHGSLMQYFVLASFCMALSAIVCLVFMKTCGAFDE